MCVSPEGSGIRAILLDRRTTPGHRLEAVFVTTDQTAIAGGTSVGDGDLLKIRISNLPQSAIEPQIRALFLPHGTAQFYSRPLNEHTRRPDTIAYVELPTSQAATAIKALKGTQLGGNVLTFEVATPLASWAVNTSRGPESVKPRRIVTPYAPGERGASRA